MKTTCFEFSGQCSSSEKNRISGQDHTDERIVICIVSLYYFRGVNISTAAAIKSKTVNLSRQDWKAYACASIINKSDFTSFTRGLFDSLFRSLSYLHRTIMKNPLQNYPLLLLLAPGLEYTRSQRSTAAGILEPNPSRYEPYSL